MPASKTAAVTAASTGATIWQKLLYAQHLQQYQESAGSDTGCTPVWGRLRRRLPWLCDLQAQHWLALALLAKLIEKS